jgi:hypothetical protein
MPTLTKKLLSGSTNGKPIKVAASATPGTNIHTCAAGVGQIEFVTLYVDNDDASTDRTLTLEIGGTTDPDNLLKVFVPKRGSDGDGRRCILKNQPLQNGLSIAAFCDSANKLKITGHVTQYA